MPEASTDYRVAVFGAGGVGKSSIVLRFVKGTFSDSYVPTIEDTYRQGHAFLLVYSVTSRQSLEELGPIILMLKEVKGVELDETPIMLVGNKCDEESDRKVSKELGAKLADKWGTGFIETSAKADLNIRELFEQLLSMEKKRQLTLTLDESGKKEKKSRKCTLL